MTTLVFVHVHKTGGITVTKALSALFNSQKVFDHVGLGVPESLESFDFVATHASFNVIKEARGSKILITALRNPVNRLLSLFNFWKSVNLNHAIAIGDGRVLLIKRLSFEQFLIDPPTSLLPYLDNEMTRHFASEDGEVTQDTFVAARDNLEMCSEIFLQEALDEDLGRLFHKLGCGNRFNVARLNVTENNFNDNPKAFDAPDRADLASLSEEAIAALLHFTRYDRMLYDVGVELREPRKYTRDVRLDDLAIKRPALYLGETIVPSTGSQFLDLLTHGWEAAGEVLWSVSRKSGLKFRIESNGRKVSKITIKFLAPLIKNRDYFVAKITFNERANRQVLFINNDITIENIGTMLGDRCLICTGVAEAEVEFGHEHIAAPGQDNTIIFETLGGASPQMLGFNHDQRELGVRLCSLKVS